MEENKKKKILLTGLSYIGYNMAQSLAQTTGDMQVYRNFETNEVTSNPPLDKVFTIENYSGDYKSGRENRRQRRKEQRKKK